MSIILTEIDILIEDSTPCITSLRSRVDAIQRLEPPKTPKECKKFLWTCKLFVHVSEESAEKVNSYLQLD